MHTQPDDNDMSERELLQSQLRTLRVIAVLLFLLVAVAALSYQRLGEVLSALT